MYKPAPSPQFEPITSTSSKDCVAAVTAMLIDRATVDGIRTNHAVVRQYSGAPSSRGLTETEAARAALAISRGTVVLEGRYGLTNAQMRDLAASGRAFGLFMSCKVTRYTRFRTNSFTGLHELYVQSYKASTDEFMIEDPGTTSAGYMYWPAALVYKAGQAATGGRGHRLLVARDTEGVNRIVQSEGPIRSRPDAESASKGTLKLGTSRTVLATTNGGPAKRIDGTTGDGWHKVKVGLTGHGFVTGRRLR